MGEHLLEVKNLQTVFHTDGELVRAVENVSFYVDAGEIISIVGESGSGKSVSLMSTLQLIQTPPGEIVGGEVWFEGNNLLEWDADGREIRAVRGGKISMIFQEPMTSLNPVLTIGRQISESIQLHLGYSAEQAKARAVELLGMVGIPDGEERYGYYPTQFSGGMRQRIMIAMALSCNPKLLIADEATTALDVTTQEQILELMRDIVRKTGTALVIVTHNLSIVARYAQRIYVMYAGTMMECGTTEELFLHPAHPYTIGLLRAIPRLDGDKGRRLAAIEGAPPNPADKDGHCPFRLRCAFARESCGQDPIPAMRRISETQAAACPFEADPARLELPSAEAGGEKKIGLPLLELHEVKKYFPVYKGVFRKKIADVKALDRVSFTVNAGETVGLVGESGCGKTTLAKAILRAHDVTDGSILFDGEDVTHLPELQLGNLRRSMQFIFQDPYGSLDPRQSAGSIVGEPLRTHKLTKTRAEYDERVDELFRWVGLDPAMRDRVPHEFSGGQRQRLSIARALASNPSLLVCDEPISALDVSIQAQIINLLEDLQAELGLSYLFIAHDLSVVRHISDRIVVMYLGRVMEISPWDELYTRPLHPYTQALLSAIPIPDPVVEKNRRRIRLEGEVPSLVNRPEGCVFHNRCPHAAPRCREEAPLLQDFGGGHSAACFHLK